MAKKKKVVNLSDKNISFKEKDKLIKVISFNPNSMEVEVSITYERDETTVMKMPLGHLPKEIKKIIRPV